MMFSGYYKEPEKTAEVMRDGWLLTGDLGEMDDGGFLKITGRKKELIVLSTGKNVAPALVENMIKESHLVSHAFVYGDGRSYLVALVTLNAAEAADYARAHGIEHTSIAELARDERVRAHVQEIIERANRRVSSSESVKKFLVLEQRLPGRARRGDADHEAQARRVGEELRGRVAELLPLRARLESKERGQE